MKQTVLALMLDVTPLTRAIISRAFKPAELEVLWTANVPEVVEASTRQRVDLLLLDLNQPLHKGWGIIERLIAHNRGAPVVILTEYKSQYEEALAGQAGAVLQKPFRVAALMHAVNVLLAKPLSTGAPAANHDAGLRNATTKLDDFREKLHQRYAAPYGVVTHYRDWGINE